MAGDIITSFMSLFVGNGRSFGRFFPDRVKDPMVTIKTSYEYDNFRAHLQGKVGIGIVPILDDGTCRFAAIDIDAHGDNDPLIDVPALSVRVEKAGIPVVVCKSKGKGAHLYAFFSEPVAAQAARITMQRWANELGYAGAEIFPKQTHLPVDRNTGTRALGQWINLPYFGGDKRVCFDGGREVGLELFIEIAKSRLIAADELSKFNLVDHAQAPPCVQRMMLEGVRGGEGLSNRALYNATIYFKRAFEQDYRQRARDFAATILQRPLDEMERERTIKSAGQRDYSYKCKEEPIQSLCDRQTCLTRKYGISLGDDDDHPTVEFSALMKLDTNPPRWQISANGIPMSFTTNELHSFPTVRTRIWETHHVWIRIMTAKEWEKRLTELAKSLQVVEAPEDVSRPGMIRVRLMQYLNKAGIDDGQDKRAQFAATTKPPPTWITYDGKEVPAGRYVIFDFNEFKEFLRKNRTDDVKEGADLHLILKMFCECKSLRLKIGQQPRSVQAISAASIQRFEGSAVIDEAEM